MFFNKLARGLGLGLLLSVVAATQIVAKPIQVIAITEDFASIAKSVGGEHVQVQSLIKGSHNLHSINPKPSMVVKVRHAELLIRLGMGQDKWIDGLIQAARNPRIFHGRTGYLDASLHIRKLEVPSGKIDGRHGDVHKYGNPHYWLNPENGRVIARHIRDHLSEIQPEHKAAFQKNYQTFSKQLDAKLKEWRRKSLALQDTQFVTYHSVWSYFFDGFNLQGAGQLEVLPGIPPTTRHLAQLETKVRSRHKSVIVLTASYYPRRAGDTFAKRTNGRHIIAPANVGESGTRSYFELFDYIFDKLKP